MMVNGIDDPETTLLRREVILKKSFLKRLYCQWYGILIEKTGLKPGMKVLELGSGAGFIKIIQPDIITSDILPLDHCDMVLSAEKIPFPDNCLHGIIMLDVFHHIPDCRNFLKEAQRTLAANGKIVMIEPANTLWSRIIYRYFHHESFDTKTKNWSFPSSGPLSGANSALAWVVFKRDAIKFQDEFPGLKIKRIQYHTPFRYLLSGGLTSFTFAPGWSFVIATFIENLLKPLFIWLGMFQTIEIMKHED